MVRFNTLKGLRFLDFDGGGLIRIDIRKLPLVEECEWGHEMMRGARRYSFFNVMVLRRYSVIREEV